MNSEDSLSQTHRSQESSVDFLQPTSESLGFLLADTTRLTRRVWAKYLEGKEFTLAELKALMFVARNQGIRQVELADLLDIQPITLARLIDQLVEGGLVERRPHPTDRRAFQLFLLDKAKPELEACAKDGAVFQKEALAGLTPEQVEALFLGLNRVRANILSMLP